MTESSPEVKRLELRLWHYELAVKRLASNCQDAESLRILAELEAGLAKANEDADRDLDALLSKAWVLLVQETERPSGRVTKSWHPMSSATGLLMGDHASPEQMRSAICEALDRAGRRSTDRGFAGLTSPAFSLVEDLLQGHVLTLDDGTSLKLVQAHLYQPTPE